MYPPKKEGNYLVKLDKFSYSIAFYDLKIWRSNDTDQEINILAWTDFPTTDIDTPF